MTSEKPLGRAQRLALIFRGAGTRWALPASAVLEVVPPPSSRPATHNGLAVEDFSELLGESPTRDTRAVTLVLDRAPPRALLVDGVEEVADLATAPFFRLPAGVAAPLGGLIRGAVLRSGGLVLELEPQVVAEAKLDQLERPHPRELCTAAAPGEPPGKALVFEAAGRLLGVPLPLVTSVLRAIAPCRVPLAPFGIVGLVHHERSLLPLFDLSLLTGGAPTLGDLAVALDVDGLAVGVVASKVIGVMEGFGGEPELVPGGAGWIALKGKQQVFFFALDQWL